MDFSITSFFPLEFFSVSELFNIPDIVHLLIRSEYPTVWSVPSPESELPDSLVGR
jgi:hypothetical protein